MKRALLLLTGLSVASCDGGTPPADAPAAQNGAADLAARDEALGPVRFEVVDQLSLMDSRYDGPTGVVRVAKLDNDDGTFTVLARTQAVSKSGTAMVGEAASALQQLLTACSGDLREVCSASRDLHLRIHAEEESFGSAGGDSPLGFQAPATAWSQAPASAEAALERIEVLPATAVGRAALVGLVRGGGSPSRLAQVLCAGRSAGPAAAVTRGGLRSLLTSGGRPSP